MIDSSEISDRKERAGTSWFYFIIIFLNSGIFFLSDHKRTGIPFSRELYLAMLCIVVAWFVFRHRHWFFEFSINTRLLFYVILAFSLPPIFALMKFGQPLAYGFLEERRTLFFLVFIPIFYGLCVKDISPDDIIKYVKISAGLCIAVACLYFFGILSLNQDISFATQDLTEEHAWDLRYSTRFRVGSVYIVFSLLIILFQLAKSKISIFDTFFIIASLGYLYFIDQSRLLMLLVGCVCLYLLLTNTKFLIRLIIPMIFSALVLISFSIGSDLLQAPIEKLTFLYDEATMPIEERVRYKTLTIIFHELMDNYFVGMGSLSQQWNEGFKTYYFDDFFLSDVGLIGLSYRYGILVLVIIFLYYQMFISGMKGLHSYLVNGLAWTYLINGLLLLFFDSMILQGGQVTGILFALLYYEKYYMMNNHD